MVEARIPRTANCPLIMIKCHILRIRIGAALDAGRPLSGRLESHLAHCPECTAWCRTQRELAGRLRQTVPRVEAPPFLQERILRAIGNSRPQPEASSWMWRAGAVAAAVVAVLAIPMPQRGHQKGLADTATGTKFLSSDVLPASTSSDSSGGNRWLQSAVAMDQPLRREFNLLKVDGLNTLRALKAGFVPGIILPDND
jgi:hypothetical protein